MDKSLSFLSFIFLIHRLLLFTCIVLRGHYHSFLSISYLSFSFCRLVGILLHNGVSLRVRVVLVLVELSHIPLVQHAVGEELIDAGLSVAGELPVVKLRVAVPHEVRVDVIVTLLRRSIGDVRALVPLAGFSFALAAAFCTDFAFTFAAALGRADGQPCC